MAADDSLPLDKQPITADRLQGFKQLERVAKLLSKVHEVGCGRDTAGNREWQVILMALHLQGLASDDDVLKELNKPDNTGIKLRAKDELWKKIGY